MSDEDLSFAAAEVVTPLIELVVVVWSFADTEAAVAVRVVGDDRICARTEEVKLSRTVEIWVLAMAEEAAAAPDEAVVWSFVGIVAAATDVVGSLTTAAGDGVPEMLVV